MLGAVDDIAPQNIVALLDHVRNRSPVLLLVASTPRRTTTVMRYRSAQSGDHPRV
jgi:hypothetical protein